MRGGGAAPHGLCAPWARWAGGAGCVGEFVVVVVVPGGWVASGRAGKNKKEKNCDVAKKKRICVEKIGLRKK